MNLLDLTLLAALVIAAIGGYRMGLVARGASWVGVAAGIALSIWAVPAVLGWFEAGSATLRLLLGLGVLMLSISLGASLGDLVGYRLRRVIHATPLRPLDRIGGVAAGAFGILLVLWFLLPAAASVPGFVSRQVRGSAIVAWVRSVSPSPPDPLQAIGRLVEDSRFPEVFADLRPAPDTGPPPSEIPVPQDVVQAVTASTVNVESRGCGARYEGSGFALDADTVVTNAHVVAGADKVQVRRPDGKVLPAEVTNFDDNRDLAVLHVPSLGQQPLALTDAEAGVDGATIGYPGGQNTPKVSPVHVEQQRTAVGRDIYGQDTTRRQVLFLSARLAQGDSGSPVIDASGKVLGVVFAISPDRASTAYALASSEVRGLLDEQPHPGTGRCQH